MGMVVEFPADATQRRAAATDMARQEGTGTVLILPVIRIERHDGDVCGGSTDQGSPSGRGRKRRSRR